MKLAVATIFCLLLADAGWSQATNRPGVRQTNAPPAAVNITPTGITNNMKVIAGAYVTCTNANFTNFDAAGTAVLTNRALTTTNNLYILRPGGSIRGSNALSGKLIPL